MQSESQCRFCAKLPVVHNHHAGVPARCPLCKGPLIEDRGSGTTYRYEDPPEGPPPPSRSLGRKLAALLGITASILLVWLLIKPHAPETVVASQNRPIAQDREMAQAAESLDPVADESSRYAMAKAGAGMAELSAKAPAGEGAVASKPRSFKGMTKNRPLYADGFYSRAKAGTYRPQFKRDSLAAKMPWKELTESELLVQLQAIPEAGLVPKFQSAMEEKKGKKTPNHAGYLAELKRLNPQAQGLPFVLPDCQLPTSAVEDFQLYAVSLRISLDALGQDNTSISESVRRRVVVQGLREPYNHIKESFDRPDSQEESSAQQLPKEKTVSAPAMAVSLQLMMDQDKVIRRVLISSLEEIADRQATVSLAKRALFDLDADNRMRAVQSLKTRAKEDYTPVLLEGLRYPWPAVAHNAALALVTLKRSDLVPQLVVAFNQPDPDLPYTEAGVSKVREMVRLNHHRNCLMCHAPSYSSEDPLRVSIPSPDRPLPRPFSVNEYCSGESLAVRPDVTFLRQDFSALMEVSNPGEWRSTQRFDFMIRVRELKKEELASFKNRPESSEYKTAIRFALQELAGPYLESTIAAWAQKK